MAIAARAARERVASCTHCTARAAVRVERDGTVATEKAAHSMLGAIVGAAAGLILARRIAGRAVRHELMHGALVAIAVGALGGALVAYLAGQQKWNVAFLVLMVTVLAMVFVALGLMAGGA
jgi:hypothetical protein